LRSLSRWLDVAERERVKDMVVEEVVAAMAISPGPQGQCVPQIHANAGNATERAQKRLRALLEPTELAAPAGPGGRTDRENAIAVLDGYFSMDTRLPDVATDPLDFYRNAGKLGQATCMEEQLLKPLVRKYLAVPGANHRIERHWSSTRHYLEYTKSGIASKTVGDCMVLHYNSEKLCLWPPKPVKF
jgi:hypothetical protein